MYASDGGLRAVPFDADRLEVTGEPVLVLEGLHVSRGFNTADFDFSETGSLVYMARPQWTLVWVDRQGGQEPVGVLAGYPIYSNPALSPDGGRIVFEVENDNGVDLFIYDLRRDIQIQFTVDPSDDRFPLWTGDGQRVVFYSYRRAAACSPRPRTGLAGSSS